jgi:hypothetical protein
MSLGLGPKVLSRCKGSHLAMAVRIWGRILGVTTARLAEVVTLRKTRSREELRVGLSVVTFIIVVVMRGGL